MKFIFLMSSILLISACTTVYVPNVVNTPLLIKKSDYRVSAHTGVTSFDFQSSFSPTDNIGLMFNLSDLDRKDSNEKVNQFLAECGIGIYKPLGNRFITECYFGYGRGNVNSYEFEKDTHAIFDQVKGQYNKFFIQPCVGVYTEKLDFSLVTRFSQIQFDKITRPLEHSNEPKKALFMEPAFTVKYGTKNIRFMGQFGICRSLTDDVIGNYDQRIYSIGIELRNDFFNGRF